MVIDYVFHDETQMSMSKNILIVSSPIGKKIRKALDKIKKHILDEVA